jgi:hypothetical protein
VLAASVVLLVLVGGIVGTTWQAAVASRQRDRAVQAEARAREETQAKEQAHRDEAEQRRLADERRRQEQGKPADAEPLYGQAIEARQRLRSEGESHGPSTNDK